jgi:hypothetical protein
MIAGTPSNAIHCLKFEREARYVEGFFLNQGFFHLLDRRFKKSLGTAFEKERSEGWQFPSIGQ